MFIDSLKITLKELIINKMAVGVWGAAGIGKSAIVRQIAKELTEEYRKELEDEES